jgi:hypothetical protein
MDMFYPFSFRWMFSRLLMVMLIGTVLLSVGVGIGVVHGAQGEAHFSIAPTSFSSSNASPRDYFIYNSTPTALIHDSIHVTNVGAVTGTVDLYPADATTGQTSGTTLLTSHDPRRDVGAWITLGRQQITLNPGQSQDIPFSLRIPSHVRPGQHGGGIVAEAVMPQTSSSTSGLMQVDVKILSRLGIGVLVNLPGTIVEKLNAMGVAYDNKSHYQRVLVGLENTGTQLLHPSGSLQVTDEHGRQIQSVLMKLNTILPLTSINYPVYIRHTELNPGTYTATLSLKYEHSHILKYVTSFMVPLPQVQNPVLSHVLSDLVTPHANFFSALAPWYYVVGISLLFVLLSGLFFWGQRLYKSSANWRGNSRTGRDDA